MIHTVGARQTIVLSMFVFLLGFPILCFAGQHEQAILPPPVLSSKYYPCSQCHVQGEIPHPKRVQEEHDAVRFQGHLKGNYDCFSCHDSTHFDTLRLFDGSKIALHSSSKLCGQCHSTSYKFWQSGLHGKVTGKWNGERLFTPCTTCHNPHQPAFADQKPGAAPTPPEKTLRWKK